MNEQIKALYHLETESSRLDFEQDPDYQLYYTQAQALWEGGEMPPSSSISWIPAIPWPSPMGFVLDSTYVGTSFLDRLQFPCDKNCEK